jgi:hypothetical protein
MTDEFFNEDNFEEPEEDNTLDAFDEFLDGIEDGGSIFDPTQIVSIRTTQGGSYDVPVEGELPIAEVLEKAGLAVSPNTQYWVNNAQVAADFLVAPGAVVTAVGMVKGGAA